MDHQSDLRTFLSMLWQWAWLLILLTIIVGVTTYFISIQIRPVYQASTTLLINEGTATKATDYTSILTSERLARTYTNLLTKTPVLEGVISILKLNMSISQLRSSITSQLVRDTQLIELDVENPDPVQAALIANTIVQVFTQQNQAFQASRYAASKQSLETQLSEISTLIQKTEADLAVLGSSPERVQERDRFETMLAQYRQTYSTLLQSYEQVRVTEAQSMSNVISVEPATPSYTPIRPKILQNTILASVIGLFLAIGIIYLAETLDDTLKDPEEVKTILNLPILGWIAHIDHNQKELITYNMPRSPVAEAFRSLRTNIQFASVDVVMRTLMVTSPSPQEGKTTIASNLGIVMAQAGKRSLLVDADLRRPSLHRYFGLSNRKGMSELFIMPTLQTEGRVQETKLTGLMVLSSGEVPPNPSELLGSSRMNEILSLLRERADLTIIDAPPVMAVTDASIMAPKMDGVILVVRPGKTKLAAAKQAVEQLRRTRANIIGVVLNDVNIKHSRYKNYYETYYETSHYYLVDDSSSRSKDNGE